MDWLPGKPDDLRTQNPPQPRFIDSTEPAKQVVRLSPFRHVMWMRQRLAEIPAQKVRLPVLVIAVALAGGATGGLTATVSQHMKQNGEAVTLQGQAMSPASPQESSNVAVSSTNTPESPTNDQAYARPRRRSMLRVKPKVPAVVVYNAFDFDLLPLKKRHGKKDTEY